MSDSAPPAGPPPPLPVRVKPSVVAQAVSAATATSASASSDDPPPSSLPAPPQPPSHGPRPPPSRATPAEASSDSSAAASVPPPSLDTSQTDSSAIEPSPSPVGALVVTSPSNIILTAGSGTEPANGAVLPAATANGSEDPITAALSEEDVAVAALAEKVAKRDRIRTKVAFEIESTEASYVDSLETLVKFYITPLQQAANSDDPIISTSEIASLFSNINVIAGLNRNFLTELREKLKDWDVNKTLIGQTIKGFTPFFKMYTNYCGNHDAATELLRKLEKDNRKFRELLEANMSRPENKNLSLASYLIMPIQRIPRSQPTDRSYKLRPERSLCWEWNESHIFPNFYRVHSICFDFPFLL